MNVYCISVKLSKKKRFVFHVPLSGRVENSIGYLETNYLVHAKRTVHEFDVRGKFHVLPYLTADGWSTSRVLKFIKYTGNPSQYFQHTYICIECLFFSMENEKFQCISFLLLLRIIHFFTFAIAYELFLFTILQFRQFKKNKNKKGIKRWHWKN